MLNECLFFSFFLSVVRCGLENRSRLSFVGASPGGEFRIDKKYFIRMISNQNDGMVQASDFSSKENFVYTDQ